MSVSVCVCFVCCEFVVVVVCCCGLACWSLLLRFVDLVVACWSLVLIGVDWCCFVFFVWCCRVNLLVWRSLFVVLGCRWFLSRFSVFGVVCLFVVVPYFMSLLLLQWLFVDV